MRKADEKNAHTPPRYGRVSGRCVHGNASLHGGTLMAEHEVRVKAVARIVSKEARCSTRKAFNTHGGEASTDDLFGKSVL